MSAGVSRVTREHPCPICGGSPDLPRGAGSRCWGGIGDGFAYCTRDEHAGSLELHSSGAYRHRLRGPCACGLEHGVAIERAVVARPIPTAAERSERARGLWQSARAAQGTIVERYLRKRGITLPVPPSLRFAVTWHAPTRREVPTMIAAVQDGGAAIVAVHRTYIDPATATKIDRRMLGPCRGGAVRLAATGPELAIAEGIETALAYEQLTGRPTWAALSASGMRTVELPALPTAGRVFVGADHDAEGLTAARTLAGRLVGEGRHVRLEKPTREGLDFADLLRGVA